MKHARFFALLLIPSLGCAHMPADFTSWIVNKGLRVGECAAKQLVTRGEVKACLGPDYIRDLGTEACAQAHELLASRPTEKPAGQGEE